MTAPAPTGGPGVTGRPAATAVAAASAGAAPAGEAAAALAAMRDPLNRVYRYPLAERVVPWLATTRVTADQVTVAHAALGIAAAALVTRGSPAALLAAGVLWELHLVLDCLDGVLARARGTASALGHTHDILADAVAYLALAAAMWGHLRATAPAFPAGAVVLAMIASGALAAWAHDFYYRKLGAALGTGTDPVYEDLLAKQRAIAAGGGFVAWFGWVFSWLQVIGLEPGAIRDVAQRLRAGAAPPRPGESPEVRAIVAHAGTPSGRRALRAVALMSHDNAVAMLGLGVATGRIGAAALVVTLYATATLVVGIACCRAFLRSARRS